MDGPRGNLGNPFILKIMVQTGAGVNARKLHPGLTRGHPPLVDPGGPMAGPFADPVPQALILTAIVIGFGVLAFSLVLSHSVHESAQSDDIDDIGPDRV